MNSFIITNIGKGVISSLDINNVQLIGSGLNTYLDQTAVANAENEGRFRYYTDATYSYLECCMGSNGTYEWILISQQVL